MSGSAFYERLTAAMNARGIAAPRLAEMTGLSERSIWRWRQGQAAPGIEAAPIIARALGVPAGWLVGEGDAAVPAPVEA